MELPGRRGRRGAGTTRTNHVRQQAGRRDRRRRGALGGRRRGAPRRGGAGHHLGPPAPRGAEDEVMPGSISPSTRAAGAVARGGRESGDTLFTWGPGQRKQRGKAQKSDPSAAARARERTTRATPRGRDPAGGPEDPRRALEGGAGTSPRRRSEHPPPGSGRERPGTAQGGDPRRRAGPGRRSAQPGPPRTRGPKRGAPKA